ncbi:MAG: uncharacterized protein JWR66_4364 [Modestobacter sp.]|nr:uncharacterized protein [Modestobacter sp.]
MISPFRGDVVVTGFVLATPVFLLGMRGEFTAEEVITRLLWCLAAGWAAVSLVRWASTPPKPAPGARADDAAGETSVDGERATTA